MPLTSVSLILSLSDSLSTRSFRLTSTIFADESALAVLALESGFVSGAIVPLLVFEFAVLGAFIEELNFGLFIILTPVP